MRLGLLLLLACAIAIPGCLGKPKIEDRWTRVDVESSSLRQNQGVTSGTVVPISMSAAITYRKILTGVAVAELRASSLPANAVSLAPDADRLPMAEDIDRILANSVSMGRATREVTGWDHLIQRIDFTFDANVPAPTDSSGQGVGLFLLCYMGSGEKVERGDGTDTLIVTPFVSTQVEVLPVGLELTVMP